MNAVNAATQTIMEWVMAPLMAFPPIVALCVVSAVFGLLAMICFRYTSNQTALKRVADHTRANLLASRLFKDDMRVSLAAQGGMFKNAFLRLLYSIPPLIVLIIPFALIVAQLAMWYEFAPLKPDTEHVSVVAEVNPDAWDDALSATIETPEQVAVEARLRRAAWSTPAKTDEQGNETQAAASGGPELRWRIKTLAPTSKEPALMKISIGGQTIEKQIVINDDAGGWHYVSPVRAGTNFWDRLLYPGEPAFAPDSPIQRIVIEYPSRSNPIFGLPIHWLITFFVVSIVGALAAKPFVKVQL